MNTYQGARYGRTPQELDTFSELYGYDVRGWSGFSILREMRDLHTLTSFIRLADGGHHTQAKELAYRLDTLKRGDLHARWNAG